MMVLIIYQIHKKADAAGEKQQPEGPSETIALAEFLIFTFT